MLLDHLNNARLYQLGPLYSSLVLLQHCMIRMGVSQIISCIEKLYVYYRRLYDDFHRCSLCCMVHVGQVWAGWKKYKLLLELQQQTLDLDGAMYVRDYKFRGKPVCGFLYVKAKSWPCMIPFRSKESNGGSSCMNLIKGLAVMLHINSKCCTGCWSYMAFENVIIILCVINVDRKKAKKGEERNATSTKSMNSSH